MGKRMPDARHRAPIRFKKALAAATAFANAQVLWEIVPVFGSANARIRALVTGAGATLDVFGVGPDFDVDQVVAFGSIVGTVYTTGAGTAALVAGTENKVDVTLFGEGYLLVRLTGGGAGVISFIDVCQLPNGN